MQCYVGLCHEVSPGCFFVFCQEAFKQQTGDKPAWCIIQTNHFAEIPAGTFVVPWTQIALAKPGAGEEFSCKNYAGIDKTTEYEVEAAAAQYAT